MQGLATKNIVLLLLPSFLVTNLNSKNNLTCFNSLHFIGYDAQVRLNTFVLTFLTLRIFLAIFGQSLIQKPLVGISLDCAAPVDSLPSRVLRRRF